MDRAIADYTGAIRIDPSFMEAYRNRSLAYRARKRQYGVLASEDLRRAFRIEYNRTQKRIVRALQKLLSMVTGRGAKTKKPVFEYRKDKRDGQVYRLYVNGKLSGHRIFGAPMHPLGEPPPGARPVDTLWLGDVGLSAGEPPRLYLSLEAALQRETALAEQSYKGQITNKK